MSKISPFSGRIVFDHLGKTGGMAVTSWLMDSLGGGTVTPDVVGYHSELLRRYGGLFPIISAHIFFDVGLDPRYEYITLLRDPVDRVVSWLFYADNTVPDTPEYQLHKAGARDFIQSDGQIISDDIAESVSNYYVTHFSQIQNISGISYEEKVEVALQSLMDFKVVGIYEKFSSFLSDVSDLIGLPAPESIARVNGTSRRPMVNEITPALRARIVELNQLDIRLYNKVVAWKESLDQRRTEKAVTLFAPLWQKYEPTRERVLTTPDVVILAARLREESVVLHGQLMTFDVDFFVSREVVEIEMGIHIFDDEKRWAFGINSTLLGQCHRDLRRGSYRASYHVLADLPEGKYTAGFAFSERLLDNNRDLAWWDKLCEFQVNRRPGRPFAGYANLPAQISLSPLGAGAENFVIDRAQGTVKFRTPITQVLVNECVQLDVEISNRGEHLWKGNSIRPVRLSYHWIDANGDMAVYDGERSSLPECGISAGQTVVTNMSVVAPSLAGRYTLVPTLVQEGVTWFDEIGLESIVCVVDVSDQR